MAELDASGFADGTKLSYDLCIIGSGAAAITIAYRLRHSGLKICLLEGSLVNQPGRYSAAVLERYETTSAPEARELLTAAEVRDYGHRFQDRTAQELYGGQTSQELSVLCSSFLKATRIRVYGGSTNCWGGWTRPLSALDFNRSDLNPDWKWPITREQLEPHYRTAIGLCSLDGVTPNDYEDPNVWQAKTDTPIEPLAQKLRDVRTAVFTVMNGKGPSQPHGAWDFQIVYGPALMEAGVDVIRDANVRLLDKGSDMIRAVIGNATDRSDPENPKAGPRFFVGADRYVLAAGGIESVRLLLLSRFVNGLLGANFMIHPLNTSAAYFNGGREPNPEVKNFYNYPRPTLRGQYPPGFFASYVPTDEALVAHGIGNFRANINFSTTIDLNWEQVPNPKSQIYLNDQQRDFLGDPEVFVDWKMSDIDTKTATFALDLVEKELMALGLADSLVNKHPRPTGSGDHHMGATRMSDNPNRGVVDRDLRMHGYSNLYVASSSVFPTGGVANPTLTIIALAARLAEHLGQTH
jgi:choline dehydrogenase-like flavoprotein